MSWILVLLALLLASPAAAQRGHFVENAGTPLTKRTMLNYNAPLQAADDGSETDISLDPVPDLATDAIDSLGEISDALCGTNEILEDNGAAWVCIATPSGGGTNFDVTDTDASPIQTVNDTEQVQYIGSGTVTVDLTADASNHDVTITGSAHVSTIVELDTTATGANLNTLTGAGDADALHTHTLLATDAALTSGLAGQDTIVELDTTATGANLNTLTGAGDADALHTHTLLATDASVTAGLAAQDTIVELDTTATGAELNTLTGAGDADALHTHNLKSDAAGETYTGTHDFGGATAIEVENSATLTLATDGDVGIDTTDDQLQYRSGSATHVIHAEATKCAVIETATTSDVDVPIFAMPDLANVTANGCKVTGTSASAQLMQSDGTTSVDGAQTCATGTSITWDTTLAGTTAFTNGEIVMLDVTAASAVTWLTFCFKYTLDAQ